MPCSLYQSWASVSQARVRSHARRPHLSEPPAQFKRCADVQGHDGVGHRTPPSSHTWHGQHATPVRAHDAMQAQMYRAMMEMDAKHILPCKCDTVHPSLFSTCDIKQLCTDVQGHDGDGHQAGQLQHRWHLRQAAGRLRQQGTACMIVGLLCPGVHISGWLPGVPECFWQGAASGAAVPALFQDETSQDSTVCVLTKDVLPACLPAMA